MKISRSVKYIVLYTACLLLQNCNTTAEKDTANETEAVHKPDFYTAADFNTVEKYDTHVHINVVDSTFIDQATKDNLRLLTVNVNSGRPAEEQRAVALKLVKEFADRLHFATTFNLNNWGTEKWLPQTIAYLKQSFDSGAIAVKIWKNIG